MRVPERVYGFEHEFGYVLVSRDQDDLQSHETCFVPTIANDRGYSLYPTRALGSNGRVWHPNGSCSYIDTGDHPEHATAECRSVRDLVCHAKAGEFLIQNSIIPTPLVDLHLFKNNLGCNSRGDADGDFGCHDNYLSHLFDPADRDACNRLIPFLITRQILDGAGWWDKDGTYFFSQRALVMKAPMGKTSGERPLVQHKNTHDTGFSRRLQLICGDSTILDVATFLKVGTTSLVLSLLENGWDPGLPCSAPIHALRAFARDADAHKKVTMGTGPTFSALEVQAIYCEAARRLIRDAEFDSEATEAEMRMVVDLWERAISAIWTGDEEWMQGRLDWATKRFLAERAITRSLLTDPDEIKTLRKDIDIRYHDITDRTLQNFMNRRWADRRLVTDAEIEHAKDSPPLGTRAQLRGKFISWAMRNKQSCHVDWTVLRHLWNESDIRIADPLCSKSQELEDLMEGKSIIRE